MKQTNDQFQGLSLNGKWHIFLRTEKGGRRQFNNVVGKLIRQKRESLGITGVELARLLAVSQQQVSRYERGETSLSLYQLDRVLYVLSISWWSFIDEAAQLSALIAPTDRISKPLGYVLSTEKEGKVDNE